MNLDKAIALYEEMIGMLDTKFRDIFRRGAWFERFPALYHEVDDFIEEKLETIKSDAIELKAFRDTGIENPNSAIADIFEYIEYFGQECARLADLAYSYEDGMSNPLLPVRFTKVSGHRYTNTEWARIIWEQCADYAKMIVKELA